MRNYLTIKLWFLHNANIILTKRFPFFFVTTTEPNRHITQGRKEKKNEFKKKNRLLLHKIFTNWLLMKEERKVDRQDFSRLSDQIREEQKKN